MMQATSRSHGRALVAIAAALVALVSAFAATATAAPTATTTLRMVAITEHKEGVEALVRMFEARNPDIEIAVTLAPVDTYTTAIRAQLNSRNAPDLLMSYPGNGNAASVVQLALRRGYGPVGRGVGERHSVGVPADLAV